MSKEDIETDPKKISAIYDWPQPRTGTEVCSFLRFTNYCRKFIHKYAQIAKPWNTLVSGDNAKSKKKLVEWNEDCETAFQKLKTLYSETCLFWHMPTTKSHYVCKQMPVKKVKELFCTKYRTMVHLE